MTLLAAVLAAAAVLTGTGAQAGGARRLAGLRPAAPTPRRPLPAAAACVFAGAAAVLVVGLPAGFAVGGTIALGGPVLLARLEPASARRDREALVRDLPLLLDLLAACLSGGASLPAAAAAVAAALPGPCAQRLAAVADTLAVGTPAAEAWLELAGASADDPLAPVARLLARAADGGTPMASAVRRLAAEARANAAAAGSESARRVGVLVVAPLGLCFLPAFVLLGVVPVVAGLAAPLLGSS